MTNAGVHMDPLLFLLVACSPTVFAPPGEPGSTSTDVLQPDSVPTVVPSTSTETETADPPALLPPLGERRCAGRLPMATTMPTAPGPFPVGVRTIALTDPLRPERTLVTEVWYPADESVRGQSGVDYGLDLDDIAALAGVEDPAVLALLDALTGDDLVTVTESDAVGDAPLAAPDPARGVVVFSHGYRGIRYQSVFLTVHLASHGYVVVAPDHVGNTMFDGSEEDDVVNSINRVRDVAFLTTELERMASDPSSFLVGAYDPTRVAWTGHSFGASTVLTAGATDNREMVVVPLAPAFDERMSSVWLPSSYDLRAALMIVGASEDTTTPWDQQQLAWDRTVAPRFLTQLQGARHMDFTDLCANPQVRAIFQLIDELADSCSEDSTVTHLAIQGVVTAALDRYLACDPAADAFLGDGVETDLPGVSLFSHDPGDPGDVALQDPAAAWTTPPTTPGEDLWAGDVHAVRYDAGGTGPTLVFVPGWMDGRVFWPVVDALVPQSPVVLVDLPGHGASPPFDGPWSVDAVAGALGAVVEELAADQVVVIGWSTGGQAAMAWALRPEAASVDGLVLVGTTPAMAQDPLWPAFNGGATLEFADLLHRGDHPALVERFLAADPDPTHVAHLLGWLSEGDPATLAAEIAAPPPDLLSRLSELTVPVLLVHGEQDDAVLLESSTWLADALPDTELAVFQRSGHLPFVEEPAAFDEIVAAFVDRVQDR